MLLILLAALIVLGALGWLAGALVRTWKNVATTGRVVSEAAEKLAEASAGLQAANGQEPYRR